MSKSLATIVTQPLIVAKVGLQSRPPPERQGKPFKSFVEVMKFIIEKEGPLSLFKGIGPQILKGLLVQGILMMTKERYVFSAIIMLSIGKSRLTLHFVPVSSSCSSSSSVTSGRFGRSSSPGVAILRPLPSSWRL